MAQNKFTNKIVFITGASSGIGAACAQAFAAGGAKLLLCARREERLIELAADLKKQYGTEVHHFILDVRELKAVQQVFENLPPAWRNIDVLINNAGLAAGLAKLYEGDINDWEQMIDTNVKGLLYVTRSVVPGMVERNRGHVINIGSIAGHEIYPNGAVYCGTKAAVHSINNGLKMDLLGTKVRVTSIDPGMVETEFSLVRFHGDEARAKSIYKGMQPLTPADIADVALYAASCPAHVNIREVVLMPTCQSAVTLVHREE
jgi:3-hydroxy acid dehydrogenase/malonic semialdehyde reductase